MSTKETPAWVYNTEFNPEKWFEEVKAILRGANMSTPSEEEIENFENPQSERDQLRFIQQFLLTQVQIEILSERHISISDILNGRLSGDDALISEQLMDNWNRTLESFGMRPQFRY